MNERPRCTAEPEAIDILLINPPWFNKDQSIWHGIKGAMPPLGLLSIAAYAERAGFSVRIMDIHVEGWTIDEFRAELRRIEPRHVGISMMTSTASAANRVACCVKEVHPSCTVTVGGVHADAMPGECLRNRDIDFVVRGDGEETYCDLVAGRPYEDIRGISYRDGNRAVHNPAAATIMDLDALPMPAYHLVPMKKYYPAMGAYRRLPAINMLMTRGCPGKCTFCNSAETTLRTRSADLVVEEIAHLKRTYGIREIQFYDDTFTVMKSNVMRFCQLMKERQLGVSFTAFVRTDCLSEEMAFALRDAGCHQVMFGIESGDDRILRNIRKPIDRKRTAWAVDVAQKAGLEVRATYMFGNPGETIASMRRTIDYAIELDSDLAIFNICTPYPGTQMFDWARERGYLNTEEWDDYELSNAIMTLPTVTPDEIATVYKDAFRKFYNRPRVFWRRLMRMRSLHHFSDNIHAFFYIILRHKLGDRGQHQLEWIDAGKQDYWNVPLSDAQESVCQVRTSNVVAAPVLDDLGVGSVLGLPVLG